MKSDLIASTLLSLLFWSLLLSSMFMLPLFMRDRGGGEAELDLIRQHREAIGPGRALSSEEPAPGACAAPGNDPAFGEEMPAADGGADSRMIRPVGKRAARIQV